MLSDVLIRDVNLSVRVTAPCPKSDENRRQN